MTGHAFNKPPLTLIVDRLWTSVPVVDVVDGSIIFAESQNN